MEQTQKKKIIIGVVIAIIVLITVLVVSLDSCDGSSDVKVDKIYLNASGNVVTVQATNTSSKTIRVMFKVQLFLKDTNSPVSENYTETLTLSPGQSAEFKSYHSGANSYGYASRLDAKVVETKIY